MESMTRSATDKLEAIERIAVMVAICTYQRPLMLQKCLRSIIAQTIPRQWDLKVVVIENDASPALGDYIAELAASTHRSISHIVETERGISSARNAALNAAVSWAADWIIFIDDDEVADENWLVGYAAAIEQCDAEIIHGKVNYVYETVNRWNYLLVRESAQRPVIDGKKKHSAATDNVMIASKIFAVWGLRFDSAFSFSGGEDTEFFNRARLCGAHIVATSKPCVTTTVQVERDNLYWLFSREMRISASSVYIDAKHFGKAKALRKHSKRCLGSLMQALGCIILAPFAILRGMEIFHLCILRAILKLGKCCGSFVGLCGRLPTPYKKVDGY